MEKPIPKVWDTRPAWANIPSCLARGDKETSSRRELWWINWPNLSCEDMAATFNRHSQRRILKLACRCLCSFPIEISALAYLELFPRAFYRSFPKTWATVGWTREKQEEPARGSSNDSALKTETWRKRQPLKKGTRCFSGITSSSLRHKLSKQGNTSLQLRRPLPKLHQARQCHGIHPLPLLGTAQKWGNGHSFSIIQSIQCVWVLLPLLVSKL